MFSGRAELNGCHCEEFDEVAIVFNREYERDLAMREL